MSSLRRLSSLRCVPPRTTLAHAKAWARRAGVTRVTDITRLDRLASPVFAAIRPRSQSSAVTYGKGLLPIDAQVGAYMEAIEFYFAEPGTSPVATRWGTPREVAGAEHAADAILDYVPAFRKKIELDGPLLLAEATDVESGAPAWVPAELAFHPAPDVGQRIFGSTTNGLASGNSVLEASVHALAELIERDIWSFERLRDTSRLVTPDSLPALVSEPIERAARAGLELVVRHVPNDYGLAFFSAFVVDPERPTLKFLNGGWGCHALREIALIRAVCEAAQGRLAFIHGGRNFAAPGDDDAALWRRFSARVTATDRTIDYREIPARKAERSLEAQWRLLIRCLRRVTDAPIYRLRYTPADAPLQVIRLIVPTLENHKESTLRVGRRLKAAIDADG